MRLIDADELNKDLDLFDRDFCAHCGNEFAAGFEAARELIADAPTINAEPVHHSDYCEGWNDATEVVSYLGECIQLEKKRRIAAERTARQCIENYRPITHGRWIDRGDYVITAYGSLDLKVCSNCNAEVTLDGYDYYCPNCGAKMDEEAQDD